MQIREHLEAAFEGEPPHVPVEQPLAAGHAALLRRRIGVGAAAVASVAVISLGSVALGGHAPDSDRRLAPATGGDTPASRGPSEDSTPTVAETPWPYRGQLAYVD